MTSASQSRRLLVAVQAHAEPVLKGNSIWIGRPGVKLRSAEGTITAAGRRYEAMVAERGGRRPYEHADYAPPEARVEYRDGAMYAEARDGRMRQVRRWDPSLNGGQGGHRFTPFGRRFGHSSVRYTVDVPVVARFLRPDGSVSEPHKRNRTGEPFYVPINSDMLGGIALPGDLRVARNVGDHDRQKQFITEAITKYLLEQPRDESGNVMLPAYDQSDAIYSIDPADLGDWRMYRFSEEVTDFHADGPPTVETVLNRPLRGEHRLPAEFLWKSGLLPEALKDFSGRCCSHQIIRAVRQRSRSGRCRNAQDVFESIEDVEAVLDDLEFELYPGNYAPQPAPPLALPISEEARSELAAYIPLWVGEDNELSRGYITPRKPRELYDLQYAVTKANLTQRSSLPPLAGVLKRHGIDLETYFRLFPDTFRVLGSRVVYWPLEVDEDILEQRELPKDEPYTHEGWREVGVTSHMIAGLARRLARPVYVIHNDHKVYTSTPDGWDEQADRDHASAVVYNIWGDHAFFYQPERTCDAAKLAVRPLVEIPERCLVVHSDHLPSRVLYENQRPFDIDEVVRYHALGRSRRCDEARDDEVSEWSGHWHTYNIKDAAKALSERGLSFYPKYISPHKFTSIRIRSDRARIVITELPEHHEDLAAFCRAFSSQTGYSLPYHGESMAVVGHEALRTLFVTRRLHCDREAIAAQQGTCVCGEPLTDFEVHHKQPVALGGSSDVDNLVALCKTCHAVETDKLVMSGALYAGFASQLSPRMTELFLQTPKPKQWHYGEGITHDVSCLDVCGCRRNALTYSRYLPVFGPADEPEVFAGSREDLDTYDYFWVRCDRALDEYDSMLYDGEHLYPWFSVNYMLDWRIISLADVKYAIRAARRFTDFPRAVEAMRAAWDAVGADNTKLMVNSTVGIFNQRDRARWTVRETGVFDDMGRVDVIASEGHGLPRCAARTQIVGPETCYPIGLIALHFEVCTVHTAIRELQSIGARIHGVCVDGIFYTGDEAKVDAFIDTAYHPDDTPIYAKKKGKWQGCPANPQSREDHERDFIEQPRLVAEHDDRDFERLAQLVVANNGALITGPAGTGKTRLNQIINRLLEGKVVNTATTHAASRLMPNGKTLAHVIHSYRYGRVADVTFCVDEIGMVPLSTLVRVGGWRLLGAKFILSGDFRGQFEPIADHWRGPDVESSGIVRQLSRGLHVHLSTNRRAAGDDAHFRFYTGLYAGVGGPVPVEAARARYPWTRETCELALVVSHRKRRQLNQFYNEVRDRRGGVLVKCAAGVAHHNQPQDMWLQPGMRLLCCCRAHASLVNGVFYTVEKVDKKEVVVRMDETYRRDRTRLDEKAAAKAEQQEGEITLTHRDASLALRLSHALCYASVQGLTIRDKHILMLDLEHPHFDVRSMIVGISRVTAASQLHIATREQEESLMKRTRPAPPPPKVVEMEDSVTDSDDDE